MKEEKHKGFFLKKNVNRVGLGGSMHLAHNKGSQACMSLQD
jgi:hypothetical protein